MKAKRTAIATTLVLVLAPAFALAADGTFDKTLHVNGQVLLSVATGAGYIHVSPGNGNEVHVIGHVHGNSWAGFGGSSQDRVNEITQSPPIVQAGNLINIGKHTHYHNISIDYDVTVPQGSQVEASSGSGDLRLLNLGGALKASTGSGNIEATDLAGHVSLESGSGDIRAEFRSASDVKATTGSGSVRLENVQGGLYAQAGSGDLEVSGTPTGNWKLETGSGSITMKTGSAKFTLDASTGSGDIHSDPPLTTHGSFERHHVVGDVNGGGPTVRAETGSGDIRIH